MKLNHMIKHALVTLPFIVLVGCSSTSTEQGSSTSGQVRPNDSWSSSSSGLSSADSLQQLQSANRVYFDYNQFDIKPQYSELLDSHAAYLRANSEQRITIAGHADERGTPEYNIALGERRANAVRLYLQGRGVPSHQLYTISYGKEKPAVLGHTEDVYAKNRRAVIIY